MLSGLATAGHFEVANVCFGAVNSLRWTTAFGRSETVEYGYRSSNLFRSRTEANANPLTPALINAGVEGSSPSLSTNQIRVIAMGAEIGFWCIGGAGCQVRR